MVLYVVDENGLIFSNQSGMGGMNTIFQGHKNYLSCHIEKGTLKLNNISMLPEN